MSMLLDDIIVNMDSSTFRSYANYNTYSVTYDSATTDISRTVIITPSTPVDAFESRLNDGGSAALGAKINKTAKEKRMSVMGNSDVIENLVEKNLRSIWVSDENILQFYDNPISLINTAFNLFKFSALVEKYNNYELNEKLLFDSLKDVNSLNLNDVHNLYTHNTSEFGNIIISPKFDLRKKGSKEKREAFYKTHKEKFITSVDTMETIRAYISESIKYMDMITNDNYEYNVAYTANYTNYISLSVSLDYVTDNYMFKTIFLSDLSDAGIELYLSKNRSHDIVPLVELVAHLAQTHDGVNEDEYINYAEKELIILAVDINNSRRIRPYKLNSKMIVESRSSFNKNLSILNKLINEVDIPPIDYIFS